MPESPWGGRLLWMSLIGALLVQALIASTSRSLSAMLPGLTAGQWVGVAQSLFALMVLTVALVGGWRLYALDPPPDRRLGVSAILFLLANAVVATSFVVQTGMQWAPGGAHGEHLLHQCYQAGLALITAWLLTAIARPGLLVHALWLLQWLCGAGWLFWHFSQAAPPAEIGWPWQWGNVVVSTVLLLVLGLEMLVMAELRAWLVMLAALAGYGLYVSDLLLQEPGGLQLGLMHQVYGSLLLLTWMMVTGRMGVDGALMWSPRRSSPASVLAQAFAHSGLYGFDPARYEAELQQEAAHLERRRIAQEMHDGVGSQLVGMLAALDRRDPRERQIASSLEQCLLDVKILVDAIDDADEHVIEVLARLRYRVQPALERLGITLHWSVPLGGPLEHVRKDRSRQVLRIAQEAMANAMRHSRASAIWLRCEGDTGRRSLLLEIRDDGQGPSDLTTTRYRGKGIEGMHRRAASIGGVLTVHASDTGGTLVRLRAPLEQGR